MIIILYIYLIIGLLWFLAITAYDLSKFHLFKFLLGLIAYPVLYPVFFYLNVKKYSTCRKYLKPFSKYRMFLFNDYLELDKDEI